MLSGAAMVLSLRISGVGALALVLAGCGSRSGLLSAQPATGGSGAAGGSGGSGATGATGGTGGSAATGGMGGVGAAPGCFELEITGGAIAFVTDPSQHRHAPLLALANGAGTRVGVGSVETPVESPGPVPEHLRLTGFSPWESWPATLGPGAQASFVVGQDQLALDRGSSDDSLAIAYPAAPAPPAPLPQGQFFADAVSTSSGSFPSVVSLALAGPESHVARFVRSSDSAHLVGFESATSGHTAFHASYVAGSSVASNSFLGCATNAIAADALALTGGGFVFAFSTSRPWGTCLDDDGIDGPAHRILGGFIGGPGGGFGPVPIDIDLDDVVRFVRILPRPGGAFLFWQYEGVNAEVAPPVMMMQLGESGTPLTAPVSILDGGAALGIPAFAPLGDRFAMAWIGGSPGLGPIRVRIVSASGLALLERDLSPPEGAFAPAVSLLASPAGKELLVGWSQTQVSMQFEAFVARLCVPPTQ